MERKKPKVPEMEYAKKFPTEDLGKVVGGASPNTHIYRCPFCDKEFDDFDKDFKLHVAQHIQHIKEGVES